ncbi:hypothetical protein CC80DRAFT_593832 [Byssothecium circinans]|uniref:DUF7905 domain-containing protein n=1 Tax=Byssothecium circinans TaxID=147558 RepID=A0A6A5TVP7_9PLEO|nr:hypothetical protein CC80DRAFT_593832 [Byssothecium circinans]
MSGHNFPPRSNAQFSGRKPAQVINVPLEYRRATAFAEMERIAYTMKSEAGCEVDPKWDQGRITKFLIYGTGPNAEKAIGEINKWIMKAKTKSKESTAWAKTPAYDVNKWWYEQVWDKEAARKEMYKGPLPEDKDDSHEHVIIVDWPEDLRDRDPQVLPKDALGGPKLDGLDILRVTYEVFITPIPGPTWPVEIRGSTERGVEAAADHYQSMITKIRIQIFGSSRPVHIILDETEGLDVQLVQAEKWWPIQKHKIVPRLLHSPMMYDPGEFRKDSLHSNQVSILQHALKLGLEAIRREKGSYDFHIRFGAFGLLTSKRLPESEIGKRYPKEVFAAGISNAIGCEAKKWLMDDFHGKALLDRLIAADQFLKPVKSAGWFGYTPRTLSDVRPIFRGTWIFRDPNAPRWVEPVVDARNAGRPTPREPENQGPKLSPNASLMAVQIEWTEDEDGLYEKMEPRYFQLKPGETTPKEHLDIKLLELGDSRAWQFSMESMTLIKKSLASPALQGFASTVELKPNYKLESNEQFAKWRNTTSLPLLDGRLDKVYSFGIQKTGYRIELLGMWYPRQTQPCWGLNVRHSEWATHLAQLEWLPLGRAADWGDAISTFLPDDGLTSAGNMAEEDVDLQQLEALRLANMNIEEPPRDGTRLLLDKLMQLSLVISGADEGGGVPLPSED